MIRRPGTLFLVVLGCAIQLIWLDPTMRIEADAMRATTVAARAEATRLRSQAPYDTTAAQIPDPPAPDHPAAAVARIGRAMSSARLVSLSSGGIRPVVGHSMEELDLRLRGRLDDLISDLARLEAAPRRIGASHWSLEPSASEPGGAVYNLSLRVAYLRDATQEPPAELVVVIPDTPAAPAVPKDRPAASPAPTPRAPARSARISARNAPPLVTSSDRVEGVLFTGASRAALVEGRLMKAGDWYDEGHRIEEIGRDHIILRRRDGRAVRLVWSTGV